MKRLLFVASILALAWPVIAADVSERPTWCRDGFQCLKTSEIVADVEHHIDLREQVAKYRARGSRFGFTLGFGLGVGAVVDERFDVRWVPTGGAFLVYGIRF